LQFGDEPILEGPKEPLNPSFSLRRKGIDWLDTKLLQGPSHVGGILSAPKLLLQGPAVIIALQRTVTILIDVKGYPILPYHLLQYPQVSLRGSKEKNRATKHRLVASSMAAIK